MAARIAAKDLRRIYLSFGAREVWADWRYRNLARGGWKRSFPLVFDSSIGRCARLSKGLISRASAGG